MTMLWILRGYSPLRMTLGVGPVLKRGEGFPLSYNHYFFTCL